MPDYPPLSTKVIGETESALGALLTPLLAEAGLSFLEWVALAVTTAASAAGQALTRDQLVARIADSRKADPADVSAAIAGLAAAGALTAADGGAVTLTKAGRASHAGLQGRLAKITGYLFDFPAADLTVAGRVLATVTARANSVLAGTAPV